MVRIPRTQITHTFDPAAHPVLRIRQGERLLFQTLDALGGAVRRHEDALSVELPPEKGNPATGPVFIEGAEPGDTLAVEILRIDLDRLAYGRVKRGGILAAELRPPSANVTEVSRGIVKFNGRLRFRARPMVGVIGVAPPHGAARTFDPGPHGGNLDINEAKPGATVYLPVSVQGALLALGDVHARMGDGELNGGGLDACAEVTVRTRVVRGLGWTWPVIETPEAWCTCACGVPLSQAIQRAASAMVKLLSRCLEMSPEEAFTLVGAAADARIGQAAEIPGVPMTAYLMIGKDILPQALLP